MFCDRQQYADSVLHYCVLLQAQTPPPKQVSTDFHLPLQGYSSSFTGYCLSSTHFVSPQYHRPDWRAKLEMCSCPPHSPTTFMMVMIASNHNFPGNFGADSHRFEPSQHSMANQLRADQHYLYMNHHEPVHAPQQCCKSSHFILQKEDAWRPNSLQSF